MTARQQYITVGYYPTRKAALAALASFNGVRPVTDPTFGELYDRWWTQHSPQLSPLSVKKYTLLSKRLAPLSTVKASALTVDYLDDFFRQMDATEGVKATASGLAKQVLRYATKKGIFSSDIASMMDTFTAPKSQIRREVFSAAEIQDLRKDPSPYAAAALVALYGGWRPGEVLSLTPSQVDLDNMIITAGSKTKAGTGRTVPIHSAIQPLVRQLVENSSAVLFPFSYTSYRIWLRAKGHTPHDTRHTFATAAKNAGMDSTIRKRILGHAVTDITESVYTHATADQYRAEMEKIKY